MGVDDSGELTRRMRPFSQRTEMHSFGVFQ
jgi:hypothetical protein